MSNLNLSQSCITYSAEKPSERVQEYLRNSVVSPNQLSQYTSLQSFDEKVSADRIPSVLEELRLYEDFCVKNDQYIEASKCVKMIETLQKQEVKFSEKTMKNINQSELSELEEINLQQFKEFNEIWDKTIEEYTKELKQKEQELIQIHQQQTHEFDESIKYIQFPKTKYSIEVIQLRYLLEQLNKNKRYLESHDVKKRILELEQRDEQKWAAVFQQKVAVKRVQLLQKQKAELQALQSKLENQLQLKIRTRKYEMNKYAQWLQNMKQELSVTQGLELSRIMVQGEKRNVKVEGGQCNSSLIVSQNYSQLLDVSRSYNSTMNGNQSSIQN